MLITVTPNGNKAEIMAYLETVKNIIVVTETVGPYDILAIAPVTDLDSVQALVSEARKAPFLQRVEIACVDDIHFPVSPNFGTVLSQKSKTLSTA